MSVTQAEADAVVCQNPECEEWVEPELDGDHQYYECEECGYAFGYRKIEATTSTDSCQLGVPESVRRSASAPMEAAMKPEKAAPVGLGMPILREH